MKHHYRDIRERIAEEPLWWDEEGVPRYCEFAPNETNNIYADQAILLLIACQGCRKEFKVCMSQARYRAYINASERLGRNDLTDEDIKDYTLKEFVRSKRIHYGDPPNTGCCGGTTMNCIDLKVLEFWERPNFDWVRVPELEIEIEKAEDYDEAR